MLKSRSPAITYLLAVVAVAGGWGLRLLLTAWVGEGLPPFITFYPAVMIAALIGGMLAGVLATVLAAASVAYWLLPPAGSAIGLTQEIVSLGLFTVIGLFFAYVADRYLESRARAARYQQQELVRAVRAEADQALRDSEARFRLLIEQAPDGIFVADAGGRYLDVNEAGATMLGYSRAEIMNLAISDAIDPAEVERIPGEVARLANGAVAVSEWRFRRKDGSTFIGEVVGRQLPDGGLQGIVRDITERRRMDDELRREKALLASVTASTDVMLVYLDPQFNFVWVNQAYADTCHMAREEMVGRNHFDLYPHPDNEATFRRVRDTGEPFFVRDNPFEFPEQPERGTTYWDWSLTPVKDPGGDTIGLVFSLRETTPHVRAQQARRESEERFHNLFENMIEGFALHEIITDPDGMPVDYRFLEVNPAFESLTGLRRTDVLGKRVREVLPAIESEWIETYGRVALTGEPTHFQRHTDTLGQTFEVFAYRPAPRQFAVIVNDITEQVSAAAELTRAKEAAEAASRAKSAFLAQMSHELRTPLNVVVGLSHLLREDLAESRHAQRVGQLCTTLDHLLAVINGILDLSRIEAKHTVLESSAFRLHDLTDKVTQLLGGTAREKGLALMVDMDAGLGDMYVRGDQLCLSQVLINLVANAVKFTERGHILLRVGRGGSTDPNSARLTFAVSDTGVGIRPEDQARIFEPFEQVDDANLAARAEGGGSGLGLAICRRMVRLMGGDIEVSSHPSAGSTFRFEVVLPTVAGPAEAQAPKRPGGEAKPSGTRVLIVEDHPVARSVLKEMLDKLGCDIHMAADGVEAVEQARKNLYDLILMDVKMPRMDGFAASRAIRELAGHRETPIVALTANTFPEDKRRCLDAGMTGHIGKPLTPNALKAALATWQPGHLVGGIAVNTGGGDLDPMLSRIPGVAITCNVPDGNHKKACYTELLRQYVTMHQGDMGRLRESLGAGDADAARRLVHDLKGVSALVGARRIAELADRLHDALTTNGREVGEIIDACEREFTLLVESVRMLPRTEIELVSRMN